MMWIDSSSPIAVHGMFDELNRDHREAEPLVVEVDRSRLRMVQPPRPRFRASRSFWEMSSDEARVAELAALLAPPNIYAPALPIEPAGSPDRHAAGPSLAPVALPSAGALVRDLEGSRSAGTRFHWLAPASAGVFALGAVVATGWLQLQSGLATAWDPGPASAAAEPIGDAELFLTQDLLHAERLNVAEPPTSSAVAASSTVALPSAVEDEPAPQDARERALVRRRELAARARAHASIKRAVSLGAYLVSATSHGTAAPGPHSTPGVGTGVSTTPISSETEAAAARLPFDKAAALAALRLAASSGQACLGAEQTAHTVPVSVTFAPSGRVTSAQVGGTLAGTSQGSCVARNMRSARVPAFDGDHVTVTKTVRYR